jgi:hypothetical protein
MNLRRGLFRFWLLFAIAFVAGTSALSYETVKSEYEKWELIKQIDARGDVLQVPVDCSLARGKLNVDYVTIKGTSERNCWYGLPEFRVAYPEYKDMSDQELSDKMYVKAGEPIHKAKPLWVTLLQIATFALGVPLGVLVVGSALFWAGAGFRGQA